MKITLTFFLLLCMSIAYGQDSSSHDIDRALQTCLEQPDNYTTQGAIGCISHATEQWDAALNQAYKALVAELSESQKESLKVAQRQWIAFRDKEVAYSAQLYGDMGGTMWLPVAAQTKLDLTRQRALQLADYLSNLQLDRE